MSHRKKVHRQYIFHYSCGKNISSNAGRMSFKNKKQPKVTNQNIGQVWKVGYLRSCRHFASSSNDGKEKNELKPHNSYKDI